MGQIALTVCVACQPSTANPKAEINLPAVGIRSVGRMVLSGPCDGDLCHVAVSPTECPGTRGQVEIPHPPEAFVKTHARHFVPFVVEGLVPTAQRLAITVTELDRAQHL